MEISIREAKSGMLQITIPIDALIVDPSLPDGDWNDPWDVAVDFMDQSGLYPGMTWERGIADYYSFERYDEVVIVTLNRLVN